MLCCKLFLLLVLIIVIVNAVDELFTKPVKNDFSLLFSNARVKRRKTSHDTICVQRQTGGKTECRYCVNDECRRCMQVERCECKCECEKDMCAKCEVRNGYCNETGFPTNNDGFPIKKEQIEEIDSKDENDDENKMNGGKDENNGGDRTNFLTAQLFGIAIGVLSFMF